MGVAARQPGLCGGHSRSAMALIPAPRGAITGCFGFRLSGVAKWRLPSHALELGVLNRRWASYAGKMSQNCSLRL